MSNKYSRYLNGLVQFVNDTKPFHAKLTEVQEVYQFSESMNVDIRENWRWSVMMKAYWLYEYFSDGRSTNTFGGNRKTPIHFLNSPLFRGGSGSFFNVGRDQSNAIDFVKNVFDESSYALSDVVIQRNNKNIFLHQGLDYHKSYGSQIFRVRQTHKVGFKEWCGKQEITTSWATDGQHPVIKEVIIPNADDIRIRSGNAIKLSPTQIRILTPGTVIVDGFVSESYFPLIQEKQDEAVLAEATNSVKALAMDKTNPHSSYSRLKVLFSVIQFQINQTTAPNSQIALNRLQSIIENKIPDDFEELVVFLESENVPLPSGYSGWRGVDVTVPLNDQKYMETVLYSHSPNLLQNYFTDRGEWEYAGVSYENVEGDTFSITGIRANNYSDNFEEWTVTAYDNDTFSVTGSSSGIIGSVQIGERFTSNNISFVTNKVANKTIQTGDSLTLTPINKIVVHQNAPLEAWAIIKTDPFGYSRPNIASRRYAFITDLNSNLGTISILNNTVADGAIVITKISETEVSVIHENDTRIHGICKIGEMYNDGLVAFTINHGSEFKFQDDEIFVIDIENIPPYAQELSICYTFDCDGFDAENAVYNTVDDPYKTYFKKFEFGFDGKDFFEGSPYERDPKNSDGSDAVTYVQDFMRKLEFGYDSRFVGYDFTNFNLKFSSDDVQDGIEWRLRAKPNFDKPLKLHAYTPSNKWNLIGSAMPGDAYAPAIFDAPDSQLPGEGNRSSSDPDFDVDLFLYYSSEFALEYYDPVNLTWVVVDDHVPVNERYENSSYHLEFTIVPASKEFIAAEVHSSWYDSNDQIVKSVTYGGDCLTWITKNPPPRVVGANFISDRAPRILMHASGFSACKEVLWNMSFSNSHSYQLTGTGQKENYGNDVQAKTIDFGVDGFSVKDRENSIHYTLIPNEYGFGNGDLISFYTYSSHPNYLVCGSISGWQPPAEYNKYYWNGKIGFKITPAKFTFYQGTELVEGANNSWITSDGEFKINWSAYNIVDSTYIIQKVEDNWILIRDGVTVDAGSNQLDDGFINISVPENKFYAEDYVITVDSDDFDYAFGQDVTVMKSSGFRNVRNTDDLFIERSRKEELYMHISDGTNYQDLRPEGMPAHTFDLTTRQEPNYKLSKYSPEVEFISNWIPLSINPLDVRPSTSEFRDSASEYDIYSTVSRDLLGSIVPVDKTQILEPSEFVFDINAHAKYLPLNASIEFLINTGGVDERMAVGINEKLRWFVLGGIGGMDAMFDDHITASFTELSEFEITSNYTESIQALMKDNEFAGFLPGFDNLPFDSEITDSTNQQLSTGYFDAGVVLTDFFQEARMLLITPDRTDEQDARLSLLLQLINPWVDLSDLASISITAFLDRVRTISVDDVYLSNLVNYNLTNKFGVPNSGLGTSVQENSTSSTSADVKEYFTMQIAERNGFDTYGMGSYGFDDGSRKIVMITLSTTIGSSTYSSFVDFDGIYSQFQPTIRLTGSSFLFNKNVWIWPENELSPRKLSTRVIDTNTIEVDLYAPVTGKLAVY